MNAGCPALDSRLLDRVVPRVDRWRRFPAGPADAFGSYKEWMHFCVHLPGSGAGHLIVNASVTERALPSGADRQVRIIALGFDGEGWQGALEDFSDQHASSRPDRIAIDFGDNRLLWHEGAFHLWVATASITARLRLVPVTMPTAATSVSFGADRAVHWVAIPRLEASGWVRLGGGTRLQLDRAPAYHDHNWGRFQWGADMAWEWGFINPADRACPWSMVFVRVSDGGRRRTLSQGALLWHGGRLVRSFQDSEIAVRLGGAYRGPRPLALPRIASLLLPGASTGVPAQLSLEARSLGDALRIEFETSSVARVGIPSDVDPFRLVVLNETCGTAGVSGTVGQETFGFDGPAVVEFVRG